MSKYVKITKYHTQTSFLYLRRLDFNHSCPVHPLSESRGGGLSMMKDGAQKYLCLILENSERDQMPSVFWPFNLLQILEFLDVWDFLFKKKKN